MQFLKTWWGRILQEIEWVLYSKPIEWLRDVESLTVHWERGRALRSHLVPPHLLPLQFTVHFTLRKQIQNFLNFCTALWDCEGLAVIMNQECSHIIDIAGAKTQGGATAP